VAGLLTAEQAARAPDLEVLLAMAAGTEVRVAAIVESRLRVLGGAFRRVEEVGVPRSRLSDPAAQLVQLRQSEHVGPPTSSVGGGDVEIGFDDRRAHQHVGPALPKSTITCSSVCSLI
jgi:hypothetical protein